MLVRKKLFFISSLSLFTTSLLYADIDMMDDIFNADLQNLQNTKIESASKMKQNISDAPANLKIITKKQIQKRGYRNLTDLLSDVAGFNIMKFANAGLSSYVGIRGVMGQNYFKILRDGIEIDMTQSDNVSVGMNYPLFGIKRVEILYGGASVIYGADAVSGVINLITDMEIGTSSQISAGNSGYYYGDVKHTMKVNDNILTIQAHIHKDQQYDFDKNYPDDFPREDLVFNDEIIESAENRKLNYQPTQTKSAFFLLKNKNWELGGNYSATEDSTLTSINNRNVSSYLFQDNANLIYEMKGLYFKYNYDLSPNSSFTTTISYDSTDLDENSYFMNKYNNYEEAFKYASTQRLSVEETYTHVTHNNSFILGISAESFDSTPMTFDLSIPFVDSTATYPGSDIPVNYYKTSWLNYGIFVQEQYKFNNSWQISVAGRYNINEDYENSFTPRLALIYKQNKATTHKFIYSASFLAPSSTAKYKHYGYIFEENDGSREGDTNKYQAYSARIPNLDLEPEKSKNIEYNFSTWFNKNLLFDSSIYYTRIQNQIGDLRASDIRDSLENVTFLKVKQSYNNSEAAMYGGDISLLYKYNYKLVDIDGWFNYSYLDGYEKLDGVESELSYKKAHTLNLGATFSYNNFDITPSVKYIKDINSGASDRDAPTQKLMADDYSVTNLFVRYRYSEDIETSLNVRNLFDKRYYDVREGSSSTYLSPQESRLAIASLKIKF